MDSAPASVHVQTILAEIPVIGIVRQDDAALAGRAARAFLEGGVRLVEITLTTPSALEVIESLRESAAQHGAALGAGTVLDAAAARRASAAGAEFLVSPVHDEMVQKLGRELGAFVIPGAATPSEILRAWSWGCDLVKVYPADSLGGPGYIRTVREPLPHIALLASGVDPRQAGAYFAAGVKAIGIGNSILDRSGLHQGDLRASIAAVRRLVDEVSGQCKRTPFDELRVSGAQTSAGPFDQQPTFDPA